MIKIESDFVTSYLGINHAHHLIKNYGKEILEQIIQSLHKKNVKSNSKLFLDNNDEFNINFDEDF